MSIGSPGGFTFDSELETVVFGNIYEKLDEAGVVVCNSAGNEYSMGHGALNWASLSYGVDWVLNSYADYGVVSSPSTYSGNLSIASIENMKYPVYYISVDGINYGYTDSCSDGVHGWLDAFAGQQMIMLWCQTLALLRITWVSTFQARLPSSRGAPIRLNKRLKMPITQAPSEL
jgi:hypothetical protein